MSETLNDILEELADKCMAYGACDHPFGDCELCTCRIGFVADLELRIRQALEIEKKLEVNLEIHSTGN